MLVPLQPNRRFQHKCVTVPRNKRSELKPYIGRARADHGVRTHVQIYFSTIVAQMEWVTANSYITIGDSTAKQLMLPQGARASPPLAIALGIHLVALQLQRLLSPLGYDRLPTLPAARWAAAPQRLRVARLFARVVRQYIDDVGSLCPIITNVPSTSDDVALLMDLLENDVPVLTGMPTFPAPLSLELQTDGPGSWGRKYLETYVATSDTGYPSLEHFQKDLAALRDPTSYISHMQDSGSHLLSGAHQLPITIGGLARSMQNTDTGPARRRNGALALTRTSHANLRHGVSLRLILHALHRRHAQHLRKRDYAAAAATNDTTTKLRHLGSSPDMADF